MDLTLLFIVSYLSLQCILLVGVIIFSTVTIRKVLTTETHLRAKNHTVSRIWLKMIWKMRGIYSSLFVHLFDFFTDFLVLREWFMAEDEKGEDVPRVDATLMAWSSVSVLLFYKCISTLAIYITTDYDWKQALLQFWDLLLYREIHKSHEKFVKSLYQHDLLTLSGKQTTTLLFFLFVFFLLLALFLFFFSFVFSCLRALYVQGYSPVLQLFLFYVWYVEMDL